MYTWNTFLFNERRSGGILSVIANIFLVIVSIITYIGWNILFPISDNFYYKFKKEK